MRIKTYNKRYEAGRSGITICLLPTFELVFNEYGAKFQPNWELNIRFIWFMLSIQSSKYGRAFDKEFREEVNEE